MPQRNRGETCSRAKRHFRSAEKVLKFTFFADNLCLLELTHRGPADGGPPGESKWIPITKKVYWPPTGTAAAAGAAASQQSHNGHHPNQPNQPLNPLLPGAKSEAGSVISAHSGKKEKKVGEESKLH